MSQDPRFQLIQSRIRAFQDFPKPGLVFRDICPILKDPKALSAVITLFEEYVKKNFPQVDLIVGLDPRGFLFGPLLAQRLGVGFVLVMKKGILPGHTVSVSYDHTSGAEVECDGVSAGQKVLLIDDLLATGGTMYAAGQLMQLLGAQVLGCLTVIELKGMNGVDRIKPYPLYSLVQY